MSEDLVYISALDLRRVLPYPDLVEVLRAAFGLEWESPPRQWHRLDTEPRVGDSVLALMPCWQPGRYVGVKLATAVPLNAQHGLPTVMATYWLADASSGKPKAIIEGTELTRRRTAATSALACDCLARRESRSLLVIGTGAMAQELPLAHRCVRPIERVEVWGRRSDRAEAVAASLRQNGLNASAVQDLRRAIAAADIICSATSSREPLIRGEWLRPGVHLDLIGAHSADMRETDDEAIRRANVYVDARAGALAEAGDLISPIRSGVFTETGIRGDLRSLVSAPRPSRRDAAAITLFKSVGLALEDLAAAIYAYEAQVALSVGSRPSQSLA